MVLEHLSALEYRTLTLWSHLRQETTESPSIHCGFIKGQSCWFLVNRDAMFKSLRKKLLKAQETLKHFANNRQRDVSFKVGDLVLVKLWPHKQTSTTGEPYSKLAQRFYGPFQVLQKIDTVAYKLQLPKGSRIHSVFHCSLLKPFRSSSTSEPATELPPTTIDNQPGITPLAVINTRWDNTSIDPKLLVLVQWKGLPPEDTNGKIGKFWKMFITLRTRCSSMKEGMLGSRNQTNNAPLRTHTNDPNAGATHPSTWWIMSNRIC